MTEIPAPVLDLLNAVLEAIDIPNPATVGDSEQHDAVLNERAMHARIALQSVIEDRTPGIEWTTSYLREQLEECPPTGYRAWGVPA